MKDFLAENPEIFADIEMKLKAKLGFGEPVKEKARKKWLRKLQQTSK